MRALVGTLAADPAHLTQWESGSGRNPRGSGRVGREWIQALLKGFDSVSLLESLIRCRRSLGELHSALIACLRPAGAYP